MTGAPLRVAFVDREPSSGFMTIDRQCLEASFAVKRLVYPGRPSFRWIRDVVRAVHSTDVVFAFFGSEHALVPAVVARLLGRRFVLVPGGYDYANVPEHRYGLAARGLGWLPKLLGRLCDVALPISRQTQSEFLALVPSAAPRTHLAYLAIEPREWEDPGVERRHDDVVTLAYVDEEAWSRKGIDRFVAAARADPDRRYVLAGRIEPSIQALIDRDRPDNLVCPGRLEHDELRRLFWGVGVYAQLSWHETFGVAMAEAVLCGCVPVVRSSPALLEVAGPWAVVVGAAEHEDDDAAAIGRAAATSRTWDPSVARSDLSGRFSLAARVEVLAEAVRGDLSDRSGRHRSTEDG